MELQITDQSLMINESDILDSEPLFYHDQELYAKLKTTSLPTVFALDMGLGKTQTLYKYLWNYPLTRVLVIVNNIRQLEEMQKTLGSKIVIWHSKIEDYTFEDVSSSPRLGITKIKFFQLLLHEEFEFFNQYDEYYYDEFSGLSCIASTELIEDFANLAKQLKRSGLHFDYVLKISDLFKEIMKEFCKEEYRDTIVYNVKVSDILRQTAKDLLVEYKEIQNTKTKFRLETLHLIVLKALVTDDIFMSKFTIQNKKRFALVVKSDNLRSFIKNKKFIVFDATAELNKFDYNYLGVTIDKNFSRNTFDYSNLVVNTYRVDGVKDHDLRDGKEISIDKIVQTLTDNHRDTYTFAPKRAIDPLVSTFGFVPEKLLYFFSGHDIGSNLLRDVTVLNVMATQTYPKILRVVYNHVVYGYSLDDANKHEKDISEWYMITRDLVQVIGRTAIRNHDGQQVTVNLYQVGQQYVSLMKESYFKNCKINNYDMSTDGRSKSEILIELIRIRLVQSIERDYVYIEDLLKEHFKSNVAIRGFFSRNKKHILEITSSINWLFIKKRGTLPYFKNNKIDGNVTPDYRYRVKTEQKSRKAAKSGKLSPRFAGFHVSNQSEFDDFLSNLLITQPKIKTVILCKQIQLSKYKVLQYLSTSQCACNRQGHYILLTK